MWVFPEWAYADQADRTFGNRYDDPEGLYRVLYTSESLYGCFLETLARFRPDITLYAELDEIDGESDYVRPGVVPRSWLNKRSFGSATVSGDFVDVGASASIAALRCALAKHVVEHGLADLDAATIRLSAPRSLTQLISRHAFDAGHTGVRYLSKYGDEVVNFALFEQRVTINNERTDRVEEATPGLAEALQLHHLVLENDDRPLVA